MRNNLCGINKPDLLEFLEAASTAQNIGLEWNSGPFAKVHLLTRGEPSKLVQLRLKLLVAKLPWYSDDRPSGV